MIEKIIFNFFWIFFKISKINFLIIFINMKVSFHINKNKRSNYTLEEIKNITYKLLLNKLLIPSAVREYENEACSYFVLKDYFMRKKYKIVFCICSDRPENIGIITFHRI